MTEDQQGLYLFLAAVAAFAGLFPFWTWLKVVKTRTRPVADLREGLCEIKGRVRSFSGSYISPMTKKKCVYYELVVRERRGRLTKTLVKDRKHKSFNVDDGSGEAVVNTKDAKFLLATDAHRFSGFLNKITPELEKMLRRYGESGKGSLRFRETVLEEGDEVYVLGQVELKKKKPIFVKKPGVPLLVSDRGEGYVFVRYAFLTALFWGGAAYLILKVTGYL